jgi:glycine/D-amino acid oxidase-like deaminating enzyme
MRIHAIARSAPDAEENIMSQLQTKPDCEIAVIGAGPYGLAAAAHLKGANFDTRVFGEAMSFWSQNMPKGMNLRSSLIASDIADPRGMFSFRAYADQHPMQWSYPVPLEDFVRYGQWFQNCAVPDLDERKVVRVERDGESFRLTLQDGERVTARRVVMAMGLVNQQFRPAAFAGLPIELVSHACETIDLAAFSGKRVAVIGRGQSACESAAILNDGGADVALVSRGNIHWLGGLAADNDRPNALVWKIHELLSTKSGVGPFPFNWLAEFPDVVRRLTAQVRAAFNARCLRPGATAWLKPRFDGVKLATVNAIVAAKTAGSRVSLQFDNGTAEFDHVLLATGYHIDVGKLGILAPELLGQIGRDNGSPFLSAGLESSVTGLHFIGSSAVMSYGPLMRFVAGSGYAARHLTQTLIAKQPRGRAGVSGVFAPAFARKERMLSRF